MTTSWTQDLATGLRDIDGQHRALFASVAELRQAMRRGDVRAARRTVAFVARYVRDHFAAEERSMRSTTYPDLAAHRAAHEHFLQEFRTYEARLHDRGSTAALVLDLSEWLEAWLRDHVRRADGALGEWLRAHRAEGSAPETPRARGEG